MVALTAFLLFAPSAVPDPVEVLHRTAGVYEKARSLEYSASLSVEVPGRDLVVSFHQNGVYATAAMLPADSPVPMLEFETIGGPPAFRDHAGEEAKSDVMGIAVLGFPFESLDQADKRLISAKVLKEEPITAEGTPRSCHVIEAVYDRRTPFALGVDRPVQLWIEKETGRVWQARYERDWGNGQLARWTARIENMTFDQPPPQSAIEQMALFKGHEESNWVGKPVPDFTLKALDGETVSLHALRGRTVLLDFWATWCGPCREEMPLLEKLRAELQPQGVEVWGVTDEKPEVARQWLTDRKRTLPTLVDTDHVLFRHYGIKDIPVLMTIRADGSVSGYVVGMRGEKDIRADVAKATRPAVQ